MRVSYGDTFRVKKMSFCFATLTQKIPAQSALTGVKACRTYLRLVHAEFLQLRIQCGVKECLSRQNRIPSSAFPQLLAKLQTYGRGGACGATRGGAWRGGKREGVTHRFLCDLSGQHRPIE